MSTPEKVSAADITPLEMPPADAPAPAQTSAAAEPKPEAPTATEPANASAELDAAGEAFDPARHLAKKHPHSGRWMPKGGRKKKAAAAPGATPGGSYIPKEEPPQTAPSGEEDPKTAAPGAASTAEQPAAETRRDCSGEAAECATTAAEFVAGMIFDDPDCGNTGKHRENLVRHAQSFIQAKGWQFSVGAALFVVLVAWLLRIANRPKPRERIRSWLTPRPPEEIARNVTPGAQETKPAAEPARTAAPNRSPIIEIPNHIPPLAR